MVTSLKSLASAQYWTKALNNGNIMLSGSLYTKPNN